MTYWWNEIGDRISLFNLADICPKAWFFYPKSWDSRVRSIGIGRCMALYASFLATFVCACNMHCIFCF